MFHLAQTRLATLLIATSLLMVCALLNKIVESGQETGVGQFDDSTNLTDKQLAISLESVFGKIAKGVVYGGATFARLNNRLLCTFFTHESESDNEDQPTLFVFNGKTNRDFAYRIYADDEISVSMMEEAQFDRNQMTLILVHGWLGGIHNEVWLSEAKNVALNREKVDWTGSSHSASSARTWKPLPSLAAGSNHSGESFKPNVIVVEWSEFATGSLYTATQNSLKVSRRLARLIEQLANVGGLRPELMHCLGHSIGAHICGQAARQAFPAQPRPARGNADKGGGPEFGQRERRMGRISGLDPGGFCYELGIKNESTYLGLKPGDALLVDAYYSNRSPFGNKYQVAHYNVRLNNAFFMKPCSVWHNPERAREYFRATVRIILGSIGQNEILTCDHYFATRFAYQPVQPTCAYVGYACDSYRDFVRGKCGLCNSPGQCYQMDFEYQRANPSIAHALDHINRHSSYFNAETETEIGDNDYNYNLLDDVANDDDEQSRGRRSRGAIPYGKRPIYYIRTRDTEPFCSHTFRVRVNLDPTIVDLSSFREERLKLKFLSANGEVINLVDLARRRTSNLLSLNGPWRVNYPHEWLKMQKKYGINEWTLTALFELDISSINDYWKFKRDNTSSLYKNQLEPFIEGVIVEYDNSRNSDQNPIESIQLDYLSSTDESIKSVNSHLFLPGNFTIINMRTSSDRDIKSTKRSRQLLRKSRD